MCHSVPQLQGPLERRTAKVEIAIFRSDILTSVSIFLYRERRGNGLIQDIDLSDFYLYVAGWHFRVLALTFKDFPFDPNYKFAAKRGSSFDESGRSVCLYYKLGDSISVPKIDEGHTSKLTGFLDPSCKSHLLSFVFYAEFSASVSSVHNIIVAILSVQN